MKAAILNKAKDLVVKDIPMPKYSDDEVLIKIKEVGLCGSDVHFYNKGEISGLAVVKEPIILGHESSGVIAEVGKNVKNLKIGDRVSMEPGVPCYKCGNCRSGNYNLCNDVVFMAAPPYNGAFVEYIKYDPNFVFKVSDSVSFAEAACVEPLSVGYSCAMGAEIKPGNTVCILGSGPIGLASLDISRIMGASKIFVSDINAYRLNIAKEHGAFATINVNRENLLEVINNNTNGQGVDCVIEASGSEKAILQSLEVVKRGGKVIWVALGQDFISISYINIVAKAATIRGIFRYANSYRPIINLLESKRINFKNWISHRFKLDDIIEAFKTANNPDINKMKMIIYM